MYFFKFSIWEICEIKFYVHICVYVLVFFIKTKKTLFRKNREAALY